MLSSRLRGSDDDEQLKARPRYFTRATTDINFEVMVVDWAINFGSKSVRAYLIEIKGFSQRQYEHAIAGHAVSQWEARRSEIVTNMTAQLVDAHTASVRELNDSHLLAAKLGLAKATAFLTAVTTATDLKVLVDAIATCQRVSRIALGLPLTDEGIERLRDAKLASGEKRVDDAKHPWSGRWFTFAEIDEIVGRFRDAGVAQTAEERAT